MQETVDLKEFVGGFIAESEQLVAAATAGLLEIERANALDEPSAKAVRDLYRAMHTLKGLAGMMGIQAIVDIAHAFETVLRAADQAGGRLGQRAAELGLVAARAISDRVRAVAENKPIAAAPDPLIEELARVDVASKTVATPTAIVASWEGRLGANERQQLATALSAGRNVYTITFAPSDETAARGITIVAVRAAVAAMADIIKVAPRSTKASDDAPAGLLFELLVVSAAEPAKLAEAAATTIDRVVAVEAQAAPTSASLPELRAEEEITPLGRSYVRVELARLDDLQEQLAALVITRFRFERQINVFAAAGHDVRALRETADAQARQLRDLRRGILRVRMVRLAEVLEPLTLLVRSLFKPGLKEVRLEIDVRDSELDKAVADRLLPALVHLVRNAIDHAIEPVAEREQLGKPRAGKIRISCTEGAGNQLLLAINDDGRGVDREAVMRRSGKKLEDDTALLDILTTSGFSTRDVATETSGRGLGMDIVRRVVVSELGGELLLASERGRGTTFTLKVPLTIAIIDVFSFECGGQPFVVPVATIEEIFELGEHRGIEGPAPGRGRLPVALLERRGRPVPVIPLRTMLRIDEPVVAQKALVIRRNGEPVAFAVDRMLGRHEVVVRPIEDMLARVPGVAGATDLGDGRPTLLLDLVELGASIGSWRAEVVPS